MCGLTGFLSFERSPDVELVKKMTSSIAHRGPDSEGIYSSDRVALGHRRLSIIDTSDQSNQPFHSEDGRYHLVFNGELYNYREVLSDLPGKGHSQGDTEVILLAFKEWGIDCLKRFNGMFALAIWDSQDEVLHIARDRMGIKPLYILEKDGQLIFSSEIRPLIHSGYSDKKTNKKLLAEYFRHQTIYGPATIVQDITMLEAGHWMSVSKSGVHKEAYWTIGDSKPEIVDDLKKSVRASLQQAVSYRMISDVPLGAFLSGGIDSSAIVGLMAEQSDLPIETFSVTFGEKKFSEKEYSDLIAKRFNTKHTEINLEPEDFLSQIPEILNAFDHPSGDGPNSYVISKAVKDEGLKVALSGLGGDELFAGYDVFLNLHKLKSRPWLFSLPQAIRTLGTSLLSSNNIQSQKLKAMLTSSGHLSELHDIYRSVWLASTTSEFFRERDVPGHDWKSTTFGKESFLSDVSELEISTYMQNVLLRDTDQMSMAHALEIRVPFLDHNLVELLLSVPDKLKWPNSPKQLLVDSLGDLLPREIVDRKKMGFVFPWETWMKNQLKDVCLKGLEQLASQTLIDVKRLDDIWKQFEAGSTVYTWSRIWPLVVLGHWMKQHGIEEA